VYNSEFSAGLFNNFIILIKRQFLEGSQAIRIEEGIQDFGAMGFSIAMGISIRTHPRGYQLSHGTDLVVPLAKKRRP